MTWTCCCHISTFYYDVSYYIIVGAYYMYVCKDMKLAVNVAFQPLSLLSSLSLSPLSFSLLSFLLFLFSCIIYNEHSVYIIHIQSCISHHTFAHTQQLEQHFPGAHSTLSKTYGISFGLHDAAGPED